MYTIAGQRGIWNWNLAFHQNENLLEYVDRIEWPRQVYIANHDRETAEISTFPRHHTYRILDTLEPIVTSTELF